LSDDSKLKTGDIMEENDIRENCMLMLLIMVNFKFGGENNEST
jgi:hypothetical protein